MFDENNYYNEEYFKEQLVEEVIPHYLKNTSRTEQMIMVEDIFTYIENYYDLIGRDRPTYVCSGTGECSYTLKGYAIKGKGNISENVELSNLYVRLMQCGVSDGHDYGGTFGLPLEGEELVPFG